MKIRFNPGQVVLTPGAIDLLAEAGQTPGEFLKRHICGDWGDLSEGDKQANEKSMKTGARLMSAYPTKKANSLWIISEASDNPTQRELTTLLLPSDY